MKLKTKADGKNGFTIKPIILAAAVLAGSMSLLYAMVVTKTTTTVPIASVKPDAHPADKSKKTYKIDVSPNPVATGGTVTITVSKSCDDKSISVYVGTTAVSRKSTSGDWSGDYTAPDTGGEYTVTATDSCDDTFDRVTLTVVQLTGIKVSKDPHESGWHKTIEVDGVDNYAALKSSDNDDVVTYEGDITPETGSAKKYAHDKIVWSSATKSSDLTATVKANEELGPTPVTATLGNATKTMTNWIFWGHIKYNTTEKVNDSDKIRFNERKYNPHPLPDSEAEYAGSYSGPDANAVTYVCRNKLEIIGTLKPSGIGDILNADPNFPGLTFNWQLIERSRDWDVSPIITDKPITRKTRPDLAFIEGVNLQTQPIILDHIFATDIPGVNGVDKNDHSMAGYGAQAADYSDRIYITANTGNIPVSDEYYWHSFIKAHFSGKPVNAADFVTPTGFGPENPELPKHWGDPDKVWSK